MPSPSAASDPPARPTGFVARLRHSAAARPVLYAVGLVTLTIISGEMAAVLIRSAPAAWRHALTIVRNLATAGAMLALYAGMVRGLERRPVHELNIRRGAPLFGLGLVTGAGLMAAVYLILWALGAAALGPGAGLAGVGGGLAKAFGAAVFEELLFRGVLFGILEAATGTSVALLASAAVFGVLHGLNPGATVVSVLAIAVEAGLLLGLAYAVTGNLWAPIGLHLAWNFTEGNVFGARVSGAAETSSLIHSRLSGSDLITGGGFGPEASMISIAVCLTLSLVLGALTLRRGRWRAVRLRAQLP
jgi:membrane protease YdiL (CAAX protease family)